MRTKITLLILSVFFLSGSSNVFAQDTLEIGFQEFLSIALDNAGQMKVAETKVELAENRTEMAKSQRFLPSLSFRSEHGLVPGVASDFPEGQEYLDPNADHDWEHWGLFTRLRIQGAQPVFTWGAIGKAVTAAETAVKSTQQEKEATRAELELRLYDLYYSYTYALEIERLLRDAEDKMGQIGNALEKALDESPDEVDESDKFKFDVFRAQFGIQKKEVDESLNFVKETWAYILRNNEGVVYRPQIRFLDPVSTQLQGISYYQSSAVDNRSELKAISYGRTALEQYISSMKAQNLPGLYFGFTTTLASTPVRPKQDNPFISSPGNTFNTALGFTIRQNLNFFQARTSLKRSRLEVNRLEYLEDAAQDGVILEVNEAYRKAAVAEVKVEQTQEALTIAKQWLRMEQLDYDLGFGESKDLVDAVRQELELRLSEMQSIFEFNSAMAKLNKSAGIPLTSLTEN
jgi:outer membrane protein TolC